MWQEEDKSLDPILTNLVGGGGGGGGGSEGERGTNREKRKKERGFLERDSNFSLNFPVIGPSNSGEATRKFGPHCKSYTWVPVLWSFDKLREVGVFSYLVYFRLKSHLKWFGWCEAVSGPLVSPKTWD